MSNLGRILIVGGGIAGLTLAAALRRRRADVELIERSPHWEALGAGIAVQPNGLRMLREIGIGDAVRQAGTIVRRWLYRDQNGEVLSEIDLETLWGDVGPLIGIEHARLQEALRSGAAGVPSRLGTWVRSLRQDGQRVSVELSDGATSEFDLVVGADGVSSTVRQLAVGTDVPDYGGQMAWRSLVPFRPRELNSVQFWLGDGRFFGLCPVGPACTYGFGNVTEPRFHDAILGRRQRLCDRFAAFGGLVRDYLARLTSDEQIHCGPIEWLAMDRWHAGRVLLIGDAAHASSPMMGQGGSMAMEDAWVLAEALESTGEVESAIQRFIIRRQPRVDWVQQGSRAVGEMLRMPPEIRNAVLRERGVKLLHDRFRPLAAPP